MGCMRRVIGYNNGMSSSKPSPDTPTLAPSEMGPPSPFPEKLIDRYWSPDEVLLLGSMPDSQLAKQLGIRSWQVSWRRRFLNIPAFRFVSERYAWTAQWQALLGTMPDSKLAKRMGVRKHVVLTERMRLKIKPYEVHTTTEWDEAWTPLLGNQSDRALSEQLGIPMNVVTRQRWAKGIPPGRPMLSPRVWIPEEIALLGTMSDNQLSEQLGCTREVVTAKRRNLGIESYTNRLKKHPK